MKKTEQPKFLLYALFDGSYHFRIMLCVFAGTGLSYLHIEPLKEFSPFAIGGLLLSVFLFLDIVTKTIDQFLLKRRILKVAKQIADFQGIDPKRINMKNIEVTEDENGIQDIVIVLDDNEKTTGK